MKTKLLLIVKIFLAAAVVVNLIMNVILYNSVSNVERDLYYISNDVSSIDNDVWNLSKTVSNIEDDVEYIRYNLD